MKRIKSKEFKGLPELKGILASNPVAVINLKVAKLQKACKYLFDSFKVDGETLRVEENSPALVIESCDALIKELNEIKKTAAKADGLINPKEKKEEASKPKTTTKKKAAK